MTFCMLLNTFDHSKISDCCVDFDWHMEWVSSGVGTDLLLTG